MSISLGVYAFNMSALILCGFGFWKGDPSLRLTAVVTALSWILTPLLGTWRHHDLNLSRAILDGLTAAIYVWISMRWRRLWAVGLAAFAILAVLSPIVFVADARLHRDSWAAANNLLAVIQVGILSFALWTTLRAGRRIGEAISPGREAPSSS